jgi:hypothetical protein
MKCVSLALLFALMACSGGSKSTVPLAPLPDDKPPPDAAVAVAPPEEKPEPEPPPMPPLEVKLPAYQPTVKLTKAGKGKKTKLAYTFQVGSKQQATFTLGIKSTQTMGGTKPLKANVPSLSLTVDSEITAVAADGTATWKGVVVEADAIEVPDSPVSLEEFKANMMGTIKGITFMGTVGADGKTGEVTLRIEKPDASSLGVVQYFQFAMPNWIVVPAEAVGTGATWTVASTRTLQEDIEFTVTTTYTLANPPSARAWGAKGVTAVTGAEQTKQGATIGGFTGKGEISSAIVTGSLFPGMHSQDLTFAFTVKQGTDSLTIEYVTDGSFGGAPAAPVQNPAIKP